MHCKTNSQLEIIPHLKKDSIYLVVARWKLSSCWCQKLIQTVEPDAYGAVKRQASRYSCAKVELGNCEVSFTVWTRFFVQTMHCCLDVLNVISSPPKTFWTRRNITAFLAKCSRLDSAALACIFLYTRKWNCRKATWQFTHTCILWGCEVGHAKRGRNTSQIFPAKPSD